MALLAQFNFTNSHDIVGDLPGDLLLIFGDDFDGPIEPLHFEWQTVRTVQFGFQIAGRPNTDLSLLRSSLSYSQLSECKTSQLDRTVSEMRRQRRLEFIRRGDSMHLVKRCSLFLASCFAGIATACLDAIYLSELRFGLARSVDIVWMYFPGFTIAFAVGFVLWPFIRFDIWVLFVLSFCVGYALLPQIYFVADANVWAFGAHTLIGSFLWDLLCFPIALLGGAFCKLVSAYVRRPYVPRFSLAKLLIVACSIATFCFAIRDSRLVVLPLLLLVFFFTLAYVGLRSMWHVDAVDDRLSTVAESSRPPERELSDLAARDIAARSL
jgi:hypothetical protein